MKKIFLLVVSALLFPASVLAHHGHTSQFDPETVITISGAITKLAMVNPHAYVYLDVTDENGNVVNWHCEMRAGSLMRRSGWTKEMFADGTKIDVVGVASRKEANGCYIETIAFEGGKPIERYAQIDANKLEADAGRAAKTAWGETNIAGSWAAAQRLVGAISGPNAAAGGPGGMGMGGMGGPRGGGITLSDAGTTAQAAMAAAAAEGAGRLDCAPRDFFSDWTFDQHPNAVIQEQDTVTLKYGFMDTTRVIHLNMTEHPANLEASFGGHSIGKWYNGELWVKTTGFKANSGRRGVTSEEFHTVERFTMDVENNALKRRYLGRDPLYWTEGQMQTGEDSVFLSDYPYETYECDDRSVE